MGNVEFIITDVIRYVGSLTSEFQRLKKATCSECGYTIYVESGKGQKKRIEYFIKEHTIKGCNKEICNDI